MKRATEALSALVAEHDRRWFKRWAMTATRRDELDPQLQGDRYRHTAALIRVSAPALCGG